MHDRGIIKWQPFNSVSSSKEEMIKLNHLKEKTKLPILDDEQINLIEKKIIEAYYLKNPILITYYQNGYFYNLNSDIKKIDCLHKIIYFTNGISLYFTQIIKITD